VHGELMLTLLLEVHRDLCLANWYSRCRWERIETSTGRLPPRALVILLAGGDKRTPDRDIKTAIELARGLSARFQSRS